MIRGSSASKSLVVFWFSFAWVVGSTSSEKSMGIDTQWIIESESMNCPVCNNEIILEGTVGIYPEDTIEYIDVNFRKV